MKDREETRRYQREFRREFVNRALRRPGSVGEEVEANSVRMAYASRAAEQLWWRERTVGRAARRGR